MLELNTNPNAWTTELMNISQGLLIQGVTDHMYGLYSAWTSQARQFVPTVRIHFRLHKIKENYTPPCEISQNDTFGGSGGAILEKVVQ